MGKYIVHHDGWFFEWSTVSDRPDSWGMRRGEFEAYYREEYGRQGSERLSERLDRAERVGSSARFPEMSAEDAVSGNHAGYNETMLTLDQIVRIYCVEKREPREGEGVPNPDLEDDDGDVTP